MARALERAAEGMLTTRPNPRVGCVIVRNGEMIAEGYTAPAGGPHAEIRALETIGFDARGATLYVTLEPCSHHGRTPPCAEALVRAAPARVVVAARDPHARVDGAGLERLRSAGIQVDYGLLEAESRALNPGFIARHERGWPLVRLKLAASLDGRAAMQSGESKWITGAAARQDVQRLRARSCAIVTGSGTVLADDPALTVRSQELPELSPFDAAFLGRHPPVRVVLDRALRTPPEARILKAPNVLLCAAESAPAARRKALRTAGAEVASVADDGNGLDLEELLRLLAARECNEVLFECGPRLAAAVLEAGLVDELWLYQAPMLLGARARPMAELHFDRLAESIRFEAAEVVAVGEDLRLMLRPISAPGSNLSSPA